jgi:hypothetical protein
MAYGCQIPLFRRQWEHHILVGPPDPPFRIGGHNHIQLGVCCTCLVVPFAVQWGLEEWSELEGVHTSYRSGCGNVSRSLGCTTMTHRYVLKSFSIYIFFVNCLANNLKFNLQLWPFNDAASGPYWVIGGQRSCTSQAPLKVAT